MNIAQRTIDSYPETWIHIYTDGSAFKGTMNAGYGARVQFPDQTREELFESCGAHSSNYEAEARAMFVCLFVIDPHLWAFSPIRLQMQ